MTIKSLLEMMGVDTEGLDLPKPFVQPNLGCARCGDCCEQIHLDTRIADMIRDFIGPLPANVSPNFDFIRAHWTEIDRCEHQGQVRFSCDAYDAERKLCTAHDKRPPVCRDFPWYGRPAGDAQGGVISKRCSYWLDVHPSLRPNDTRPLLPLSVVAR